MFTVVVDCLARQVLSAHNEDGPDSAVNTSYLIHAEITGNDGRMAANYSLHTCTALCASARQT